MGIPSQAVVTLLVALGAALIICVNGGPIGTALGVLSHPDQQRRTHKLPTPQVGGIAILLGLVVWLAGSLLSGSYGNHALILVVLLCAAGVGAVGFADDQHDVSPMARILLLLVFMGAAFALDSEFVATQLNWGSFLPTGIPLWIYLPLMGATAVGLVNAVNMADGQNGIVGGLYVVWAGCLLIATSGVNAALAGVILTLALIFLSFNLSGRIFLGDCGSYGVTFVLGLLVTAAHARHDISLDTVIVWFFIPVMDCLRLLVSRVLRGRSPFEGDRDHFHHRLEDRIGKTRGLLVYVGSVGTCSVLATAMPRFALVCLCVLCALYFSFAQLTDAAVERAEVDDESDGNVISLDNANKRHHVP